MLWKFGKFPVKISSVIFMETNWFQIFTGSYKDYWLENSRAFTNFSSCIFSYSRGVFRTVSTIKDAASCKNRQRFSSKMEPFVKIKLVNYICKSLHIRCLTAFWMRLCSQATYENSNVQILVYFKDWVFLINFKPPCHSNWKQIK